MAPARRVAAMPQDWGPEYVRASPFESDPGTWAQLDDACVWRRAALPQGVLASLFRYSELPVSGGRGPVRM